MSYLDTLNDLVEIAFRIAKHSLDTNKTVNTFFVLHFPDGRTEEFHVPPDCGRLMNDFRKKEVLFRVVRMTAEAKGADAVIQASEIWGAKTTPAADALPPEVIDRLMSERDYETGVGLGLIDRHEAVMVQIQDREEVRLVSQAFRRDRNGVATFYGDRQQQTGPQAVFSGATKMFGPTYPIPPESEALLQKLLAGLEK